MKQIIYSMHFRGWTSPAAEGSGVLKATTSATSCHFHTTIGIDGVNGTYEAADGDLAFLESEITLAGADAFSETGTISFGDKHSLHFANAQDGHLGPSAQPDTMAGTVSRKVQGGEGQFAGATGFITSNFTVTNTGELNEYQFAVIFVP
jgi:hypothetical protein